MRIIDADDFFRTFPELDIEPYNNFPTVENERPKVYWNEIQAGMLVCPFCGARPHKDFKNFCAKCGADMRKGGAE